MQVVDPDIGLGFPATYRGSSRTVPASAVSDRDQTLLTLAQKAALSGDDEIILTDQTISALQVGSARTRQAPPHVELFAQIHAPDLDTLRRGRFRLLVTGAARAAGATTGRFLDLLDPDTRGRFRRAYTDMSTARAGALAVQVSCPPMQARTEGLARAPLMLPTRIGSVKLTADLGC